MGEIQNQATDLTAQKPHQEPWKIERNLRKIFLAFLSTLEIQINLPVPEK